MNERSYLDHFAQVKADAIPATIESANDDGTYFVRTVNSRALRRASKANPVDAFKVGQRVMISEPSASRSVIGSEAIIQTRAPQDQRGLSGSTPAESMAYIETTIVTGVDPDPLVIFAGGPADQQTVMGFRLTSDHEYTQPGGIDPTLEVTEISATSLAVTREIRAGGLSSTGDFVLIQDGKRAPMALRILAADPPTVLYVPGARVYAVWPEQGTLIRQSAELPFASNRVVAAGDSLVAFYAVGGAAVLTRTLATIVSFEPPFFPLPNEFGQVAYDDHGSLWYGSGNNLVKVNVLTGESDPVYAAGGDFEGVAYASFANAIFACEKGSRNVRRFSPDDDEARPTHSVLAPTTSGGTALRPRNLTVAGLGDSAFETIIVFCHPFDDEGTLGVFELDSVAPSISSPGGAETLQPGLGAFPVGVVTGAEFETWHVRRTDTVSGPYDDVPASALWLKSEEPIEVADFDVAAAGICNGRIAVLGRTADATRLRVRFYDFGIPLVFAEEVVCEAAVPATPLPSAFMGR